MFLQIRSLWWLASVGLFMALTAPAQAQSDKVTRLIVPFAPGGGTDSLARALSRRLQQELGNTVLVENKPGAGGNIALDFTASAAPDGYTLVLTTNSLVINPLIYPQVRFDPEKSFAPVAVLARSPVLILARPGLPFQTLPELIRYARQNPGKLSYGSCGNGSIHHLTGELLKSAASIDMLHVAYKGCSLAMTDLAGGQVDIGINSLTSAAAFLEAKRVVGLAVTSEKPSALVPQLPTLGSAGLTQFGFDGWYALLAPAGTPAGTVQRISEAANKALADDAVKAALAAGYLEPVGGSPAALASLIAAETARYRSITKSANIKGD